MTMCSSFSLILHNNGKREDISIINLVKGSVSRGDIIVFNILKDLETFSAIDQRYCYKIVEIEPKKDPFWPKICIKKAGQLACNVKTAKIITGEEENAISLKTVKRNRSKLCTFNRGKTTLIKRQPQFKKVA